LHGSVEESDGGVVLPLKREAVPYHTPRLGRKSIQIDDLVSSNE
jgi:hypothetical protein